MVADHEPAFLLDSTVDPNQPQPAHGLLQWHVMVRTSSDESTFQWRHGRVYSLAPPVIVLDGSEDESAEPSSATPEPNVVVDFGGSDHEALSLRFDNFNDGSDYDGLCWFRIAESGSLRRARIREAMRARAAFEKRSNRTRQAGVLS